MTNHVIVDTNVPVVANRKTAQASPTCVASCIRTIQEVRSHRILVIDDAWRILREYIANLRSTGQPGVGDAFLKWVLTNRDNPLHCTQIPLTPAPAPDERMPQVRSVWFVAHDTTFPTLATAYPLKKRRT
jgi:hypothetical protein